MARKSSKKDQSNFEKLKREMAIKKEKADHRQESEITTEESQHRSDLPQVNIDSSQITHEACEEAAVSPDSLQDRETIDQDNDIKLTIFQVEDEEYAFPITNVKEIIRIPDMIKPPNLPHGVIGLCHLRGELLPIIDTRQLFKLPLQEASELSRIIVTELDGHKLGMIADKVSEAITIHEQDIKEAPTALRGKDEGYIEGIITLGLGKRMVILLNANKLISRLNSSKKVFDQQIKETKDELRQAMEEDQIVIFGIGNEEYGISINCTREIIRLPKVSKIPNAASYIEGVFSLRKQILPLINLGMLLGNNTGLQNESSRVVIINQGEFSFGIIVDRVSRVATVQKKLLKEVSQLEYGSCSEYIKGMISLNHGKSLIMMLEPHKLINLVQEKVASASDEINKVSGLISDEGSLDMGHEQIVVFKLEQEEYALDINYVQEISRSSEIVRLPKAPQYIKGIVDLRGDIIPVLELKALLHIQDTANNSEQRLIVVHNEKRKIGILIDSVSEVLKVPTNCLEAPPQVSGGKEQTNFISKIAKLDHNKRNVMILNFSTLLGYIG